MPFIQVIILLIVLIVWWRLYTRLRANELKLIEFVEWFLLWAVVAVIALVPSVASYFAVLVGVGRGADLVTYLALLLGFYLLLKLFTKVERIERQLTSLVRALALNGAKPQDTPAAVPKAKDS